MIDSFITCPRCGAQLPPEAEWCMKCGRELVRHQAHKARGNGQGSVYKLPNEKYKAVVTIGYYLDDGGRRRRQTRSKVFDKKKDAVAALNDLRAAPRAKTIYTFKQLFDAWIPTHRAGKKTIEGYQYAAKYLEPVWHMKMDDITVDDLQECLDECPKGRRTRENMKAAIGLVYKYGIPRKAVPDNLNLAPFLAVSGEHGDARVALTDIELAKLRGCTAPHADEVLLLCYTGFRISEFLDLTDESYDPRSQTLTGGAKTDAGRNRIVTISPKVLPIVERLASSPGPLIRRSDGSAWPSVKSWTETAFYPALEAAGIDNPIVDGAAGVQRHRITPHSCRHTFANLMKRVDGADKDKQELIGHASPEMLRYYQNAELDDLRRITDAI